MAELELGLGLWQGTYQQTTGLWLRWYNAAGWVPTRAEKAEQEHQRAEQEHQRAEQEHRRAQRLAEYVRRRVRKALPQASCLSLDIARN